MKIKKITISEVIYLKNEIELNKSSMLNRLLNLYPQIVKIVRITTYHKNNNKEHIIRTLFINDLFLIPDTYDLVNEIIKKRCWLDFKTGEIKWLS